MDERDRFDCANLGGFRRSFPNPNCVSSYYHESNNRCNYHFLS